MQSMSSYWERKYIWNVGKHNFRISLNVSFYQMWMKPKTLNKLRNLLMQLLYLSISINYVEFMEKRKEMRKKCSKYKKKFSNSHFLARKLVQKISWLISFSINFIPCKRKIIFAIILFALRPQLGHPRTCLLNKHFPRDLKDFMHNQCF